MKKFSFKKLAGVAISAATLLALAPFGVANAAQVAVDSGTRGDIVMNATGDETLTGRTFKAVRIGQYDNAEGDVDQSDPTKGNLTSVAVSTVGGGSGTIARLLSPDMNAAFDETGNYGGNPVEYLIQHHGDRTDSGTVAGDAPKYDQDARKLMDKLADDSDFKDLADITDLGTPTLSNSDKVATFANIPAGVYVIFEDTAGSTDARSIPILVSTGVKVGNPEVFYNTIGSTQQLGVVDLKATTPNLGKVVDNSHPHYMIGDEVPYKITTAVPRTTGYRNYRFVVTDQPSVGLTFDKASLDIQIGNDHFDKDDLGTAKLHVTDVAPGQQVVVMDLTSYVTAVDSSGAQKYPMGTDIVIKYNMKINAHAGSSVGNDASLTFSNDPTNQASCGDNVAIDSTTGLPDENDQTCATGHKDVPTDQLPKTYLRSFKLHAVLKSDNSDITNAKFTITATGSTDPLRFTYDSATATYTVAEDQSDQANDNEVTSTGVAGTSDGILTLKGLADGVEYTVKETDNGIGGTILPTFSVTTAGETGHPANDMFTNGQDTWHLVDQPRTTPTTAATPIIVYSVKTLTGLPLTGGAGAILGVIVAIVLIGAAGGLYVFKRRENTAAIMGNAKVLN